MIRRLSWTFTIVLLYAGVAAGQQTALDRFVAQKDAVYGWKLVQTLPGDGYKTHVLSHPRSTFSGVG